jgi:hypothetical protein
VKAVNDLVGPGNIVSTLLIFKAYPRIIIDSPSLPFITKQAKIIYKAIKEVRRLYAEQQVNNALVIRNKPNTKIILTLLLQLNS